ncbi:hypothetical protein IEQ34_006140 [Dendrobium chrysotoxum]|uniref:Uncharacterized protein n=1 Tax=Dendrobium chrysotoxum TaxID=161865 RepID=A0AAV7HDU0_DENCH|nr:hypothetical protein IEQ34_006140 [Dendrobium chrysotoxum]
MEDIADEIHSFNFRLNRVPQISYYCRPQTHSYVDKETVFGKEKDERRHSELLDQLWCLQQRENYGASYSCNGRNGKSYTQPIGLRRSQVYVFDADFDVTRLLRLIIDAAIKQECKILNMEVL